jgi:lactoylglutathione lyase
MGVKGFRGMSGHRVKRFDRVKGYKVWAAIEFRSIRVMIMHLYETHLPVKSTQASKKFYVEIVGLEFAYRDPVRDIVFLWIGTKRRSMLGLWGPTTARGGDVRSCHFAIAVPLPELLLVGKRLNDLGVSTRDFMDEETTEPSVIGWMPSAQLYFRDPEGHSVEFISLLDDAPDASFIGPLTLWQKRVRD